MLCYGISDKYNLSCFQVWTLASVVPIRNKAHKNAKEENKRVFVQGVSGIKNIAS